MEDDEITKLLDAAGLDAIDPAQTLRDGTAMDRFRALVEAQVAKAREIMGLGARSAVGFSQFQEFPRAGTIPALVAYSGQQQIGIAHRPVALQ